MAVAGAPAWAAMLSAIEEAAAEREGQAPQVTAPCERLPPSLGSPASRSFLTSSEPATSSSTRLALDGS